MSNESKAVFLSYASQDAEAAKRICEALRQAGVEVWFDQSELVGGDAWDAKIRKQIKECALFVPIITPNTNARAEGYFRLEWKLAVDRSHLMADDAPFLFPIVIGDVSDTTARVPDKFRDVQWTRLRLDETPAELAGRVTKLLSADGGASLDDARGRAPGAPLRKEKSGLEKWWWLIFPIMGMLVPIIGMLKRPSRPVAPPSAAMAPAQPATSKTSEARQLAQRAAAMSVDKYNSTADDFATAEGLLKRALELEQNDAEIWAASSLLHTNIRTRGFDHNRIRREWARRDAERALKLDPNSQSALFALGRSQRDTDPAAAEATFKKLLALNPEHANAMGQVAWLAEGSGRFEEAMKLYDRVLELDPAGAPLTHYVRFLAFFHYARFAEAEVEIRRSVELQPSANSVAGLAMWLITAQGGVEAAARVLAAAPEEIRNEPRMVWVEATTHLHRRDPEAVLRALSRLSADYIQDNWFAGPQAYFAGLAHTLAGRHEAARVAWQSALAIVDTRLKETPDSGSLHLTRGQLLAWLGQPDEARREARLLDEMRSDRQNRFWVNSTAMIHAALGDADAAVPMLRRLLEVDSNTDVGWPLTRALLRNDPRWDKLRADPRFQKLSEEPVGLKTEDRSQKTAVSIPIDHKSVAVLAFANLSDDKGNEYFSDGISEELLNVLVKVPGLKVTARTSAFYFKGKDTPIPEIAKQLGVAYVVEGSVRKAGDKVRITAQLIKAADGFHVWSDTFTRDLKDIFAVQDEIAGLIAKNLELKMGLASAGAGTVNPEAYQHLLQARFFSRRHDNDGWRESVEECRAALAIDPDYALAAAEMARSYISLCRFGGIPLKEGFQAARPVAERALALNPNLPEAHSAMGWVQRTADWDWGRAEASFRRAYELAPRSAEMIRDYAVIRCNQGFIEEATELLRQSMKLDPLNASTHNYLALILSAAGRNLDESIAEMKRGLELAPAAVEWHAMLTRLLIYQGKFQEGLAAAELEPSERYRLFAHALVLAPQTDRAATAQAINKLIETHGETMSMHIAELYAVSGEVDQAFAWLERAFIRRDTPMAWILSTATMKSLAPDPRWAELLKKMGFADAPRK